MTGLSIADEELPAVSSEEQTQLSFLPASFLEQEFSLNLFYVATFAPSFVNVNNPDMLDKHSNPIVFQLFVMFMYKLFKEITTSTAGELSFQCPICLSIFSWAK